MANPKDFVAHISLLEDGTFAIKTKGPTATSVTTLVGKLSMDIEVFDEALVIDKTMGDDGEPLA